MYSDKLLGNSKLTCKWQTCAVYNRNWVLKFCGGHIYIHAVHVAISHCIFVRQHLRALNFRRPWNTLPKNILCWRWGICHKKKKIFDFFWNLKVFEDAHWSGRGSWSVHRIQVGDQGREQGGGNGWVGCKSKLKGRGTRITIPKFLKTEARGTIFDTFQNLKKPQTNRP